MSKKGLSCIEDLKQHLIKEEMNNLTTSFNALQVYQQVQQEESMLFMGKNMDSVVFTTGLTMWKMLGNFVQNNQEQFFKNKSELVNILVGDPIYGTRKILVDINKFFNSEVVKETKKNINVWV